MLEYTKYERKSFEVQAVEITEENFAEIAALIGRDTKVDEETGQKWIIIDRKVIPSLSKVTVGWTLTKMGDNDFRCYSPKIFAQQFQEPQQGGDNVQITNIFESTSYEPVSQIAGPAEQVADAADLSDPAVFGHEDS